MKHSRPKEMAAIFEAEVMVILQLVQARRGLFEMWIDMKDNNQA